MKEVDVADTTLFDVRQLFGQGDFSREKENDDFDIRQNRVDTEEFDKDYNMVNLNNVLNLSYFLASNDGISHVILDDQNI
jgi:hypothetical protein